VQLAPSGFRGIIGTSLAVDNISVGFSFVPAQTFSAALPLSVSSGTVNGAAVTGAGTLETTGSADVYSFTVPAGGLPLALSMRSCPEEDDYSPGTWTLRDASTQSVVRSGYGGCSYADFGTLAAGSYQLYVAANGMPGPYTLDILSPQSLAAALPLRTSANTMNGVSVPGASALESGASQDVYTFTVPVDGQLLNCSARRTARPWPTAAARTRTWARWRPADTSWC
jgi:hypothetical protein